MASSNVDVCVERGMSAYKLPIFVMMFYENVVILRSVFSTINEGHAA